MERWASDWALLHPTDVPFTLDNEAMIAVTKWARVTIVHTSRQQTTCGPKGSRRYEIRGRIAVQLFVDVDKGAAELAALADDTREVFEGEAIAAAGEEIALFEGATNPIATDGRWNLAVIQFPFVYYQLR